MTIALNVSLGLTLIGVFLPYGSLSRAWLSLVGFTLMGASFAAGFTTMPRLSGIAFGASVMMTGAMFALPDLWVQRPSWWDASVNHTWQFATGWACVQLLWDRARPNAPVV